MIIHREHPAKDKKSIKFDQDSKRRKGGKSEASDGKKRQGVTILTDSPSSRQFCKKVIETASGYLNNILRKNYRRLFFTLTSH
jgi:hypothetical protein